METENPHADMMPTEPDAETPEEAPKAPPARKKRRTKKKAKKTVARKAKPAAPPAPEAPSNRPYAVTVYLTERHWKYIQWRTAAESMFRRTDWTVGQSVELCVRETYQTDQRYKATQRPGAATGKRDQFNPVTGGFDL